MQTFRLNGRQRRQLRTQAKNAKDAQIVRRAIALLALDEGRPAAEVAATLGVTRQTMYNWRARLEAADVTGALRDRSGRGRRTVWTEPVRRFLEWSMELPPEELGYGSVNWTATLLRKHMENWAGLRVSDTTLREQLHRLGYAWKRPRYVLQPDPDREKKAPDQAANPRSIEGTHPARGGRDRRAAVPTSSGSVGQARRAGPGPVERPQRPARALRRHRPADRAPGAAVPQQPVRDRLLRFLRELRRRYRDRPIALLLDEDSSHTARASQHLAAELGIELLWLPKRSPELNPMEHLWRAANATERMNGSATMRRSG